MIKKEDWLWNIRISVTSNISSLSVELGLCLKLSFSKTYSMKYCPSFTTSSFTANWTFTIPGGIGPFEVGNENSTA